MITTEQIQSAGQVPESFYNIKPGGAIFYAHEDGVSSSAKQLPRQCENKPHLPSCCSHHSDVAYIDVQAAPEFLQGC